MKITKRQLRRIIKEEKAKLVKEQGRDSLYAGYDDGGPTSGGQADTRKLTAALLRDMNRGVVTAEQGEAPDELYIMTGAAEGITIKVLRKGH